MSPGLPPGLPVATQALTQYRGVGVRGAGDAETPDGRADPATSPPAGVVCRAQSGSTRPDWQWWEELLGVYDLHGVIWEWVADFQTDGHRRVPRR